MVEDGSRQTEDGAATVEQAREAFVRISAAVQDVGTASSRSPASIQEIASAGSRMQDSMNSVAAVAEQSSASSEQVSASTQQTSASTEEIAASATDLARTAEELERLVGSSRSPKLGLPIQPYRADVAFDRRVPPGATRSRGSADCADRDAKPLKDRRHTPINGRTRWIGSNRAQGGRRLYRTSPMSLLDTTQLALESAMSGSMLRQTLLTNNLANADTPGYQPEDVNFQCTLRSRCSPASRPARSPSSLHASTQRPAPTATASTPSSSRPQLAENGLLYQTLTQVAAQRESILENAMGIGQS